MGAIFQLCACINHQQADNGHYPDTQTKFTTSVDAQHSVCGLCLKVSPIVWARIQKDANIYTGIGLTGKGETEVKEEHVKSTKNMRLDK